jgi:hypothetical protein
MVFHEFDNVAATETVLRYVTRQRHISVQLKPLIKSQLS